MKSYQPEQFEHLCHKLATAHACIAAIRQQYGMPRLISRPLSFESLVQIILEQQVSLASARAAMQKLIAFTGGVSPAALSSLSAENYRLCSVSRQKAGYLQHLATTILTGKLNLQQLNHMSDDEVRQQLMQVKGIGPWTADIVLMMCMLRSDILPLGDLALVQSFRYEHGDNPISTAQIAAYAIRYAPYRSIATYFYWHAYIVRKKIALP
ncbi:MAG: DNA-3-methyladenine glycosylase 2 family protein [Chitinophagaceae bacterium]|nr:DNA-3-methyladenine glycosylase 2 family protein [Chitinophagaceae bacterium]